MASVQLELIADCVKTFLGVFITAVHYPPIRMEESRGTQIGLGVPPITGAGGATASTQYTLVHPIKFRPILLCLQNLLLTLLLRTLPFQPRLNALILAIEISQIHHQILYHKHVREWSHGRGRPSIRDLRQACETVTAINIHSAGPADALTAGAAEGESGVHLILDLD